MTSKAMWPKVPPALSVEQIEAREKFMKLWHEILPNKYGIIEKFNHGFVAKLPFKPGSKTLEVGAGLGEHCKYEDLKQQEYHCLEYREEFCKEIRKILPAGQVWCGDIHQTQSAWTPQTFDRVIAVHVLEHLPNLPVALVEIARVLKHDGVFDIVIPCEGGMAHTFARKISAERIFRKNFKMDFTPICKNEHVNTYSDVMGAVKELFTIEKSSFFPLIVPIATFNLAAGFRLRKRAP